LRQNFKKAASSKDEIKMDQLRGVYVKELEKQQGKITDILKQAPALSLALLNILQDQNLIDKDKNIDLLSQSLVKFKRAGRITITLQSLQTWSRKLKVTAIGQTCS